MLLHVPVLQVWLETHWFHAQLRRSHFQWKVSQNVQLIQTVHQVSQPICHIILLCINQCYLH